jgi:hypothetical protein
MEVNARSDVFKTRITCTPSDQPSDLGYGGKRETASVHGLEGHDIKIEHWTRKAWEMLEVWISGVSEKAYCDEAASD